jgi:hypothetical protein
MDVGVDIRTGTVSGTNVGVPDALSPPQHQASDAYSSFTPNDSFADDATLDSTVIADTAMLIASRNGGQSASGTGSGAGTGLGLGDTHRGGLPVVAAWQQETLDDLDEEIEGGDGAGPSAAGDGVEYSYETTSADATMDRTYLPEAAHGDMGVDLVSGRGTASSATIATSAGAGTAVGASAAVMASDEPSVGDASSADVDMTYFDRSVDPMRVDAQQGRGYFEEINADKSKKNSNGTNNMSFMEDGDYTLDTADKTLGSVDIPLDMGVAVGSMFDSDHDEE